MKYNNVIGADIYVKREKVVRAKLSKIRGGVDLNQVS